VRHSFHYTTHQRSYKSLFASFLEMSSGAIPFFCFSGLYLKRDYGFVFSHAGMLSGTEATLT
jgi:hypothetical protein